MFNLSEKEKKGAIAILLIIFLAYVIPYTVLTEVTKWYGSLLFWIILTIIVIGINFYLTNDWGKEE